MMKRLLLIVLSLLLIIGCEKAEVKYFKDENDIMYVEYNGKKSSQKPYSGKLLKFYQNGQNKSEYSYKDGKEDGIFTQWYENGKKKKEGTSKNGEWDGLVTSWWENGHKSSAVHYKNDVISEIVGRWGEDGSIIWTIDGSRK